jgi:anti-sigma regulatory factor (Ser/Thr protein kinase)
MQARLTLRADAGALLRIEGFVTTFAAEHAIDGADAARVLIVLEELLTNLQRYGGRPEAEPGVVGVALALDGDRLTIEFADDGPPFDPLAAPPPDLDSALDARAAGGLGLHIVRALAEEAHYARSATGNLVRLARRVSFAERR